MAKVGIPLLLIKGKPYYIRPGYYSNGRIAFRIISVTHEPLMTLTVNLPRDPLEKGEIFVKTWGGNELYIPAVLASGLFLDTGKRVKTGFVEASVWKLSEAWDLATKGGA